MKNILIAIDFKDNPLALIDNVLKVLDTTGAKIWLVHAAAPDPDFVGYEPGPQYIRDDRAKELRGEHKELAGYVTSLSNRGYVADALLVQGATVETIISETKKLNADILVIGHRQHSWLYKIFNQETTAETINRASVPVLVIPL
ncbi:universal stress protein [Mucilaginibacter hurinus]|uniref:Universal stress protein n=1 Tax=Mucilaginibacter hurinus TaxID=2201324 RepID=A0A367GS61_9SPHI|nr:universal stress protein [Mucilaginibacter hurinus]RCH55915.1 universal stress protein [Mucilaginibacter hurinus]